MSEASPGFIAKLLTRARRSSQGPSGQGASSTAPSPPRPTSPFFLEPQTSEEREDLLNALSDAYFDPSGDPLAEELAALPVSFTVQDLEAAAEEKATALEAVSEKLSSHILRNYTAFAAGVDEVVGTEELLESARLRAKIARERLAVAAAEVAGGVDVWRNTRRKAALAAVAEAAGRLRRASELAATTADAVAAGDFCQALWLADNLAAAALALGPDSRVAETLLTRAREAADAAGAQTRATLAALTTEFQPDAFEKVLQGYALAAGSALAAEAQGEVDPGADVRAAFAAAPAAAAQKVLRGVLLARAGLEDRAAAAQGLPALVALLPSDLFRTCLARVMAVLWDVLAAHHAAEQWLTSVNASSTAAAALNGAALNGSDANGTATANGSASTTSGLYGHPNAAELEERDDSADDEVAELAERLQFVLSAAAAGLIDSRRLLWDEASRAVGALLSSPAAVEGEHFMQVVAWTQRLAEAGEAFSSVEATALRAVLQRQAGAFFAAYHASNVEALSSMLEKENWQRLPATPPPLLPTKPPAVAPLQPSTAPSFQSFDELIEAGNPWQKRRPGSSPGGMTLSTPSSASSASALPRLGFGGASGIIDDAGTAAASLDVDEDGLFRSEDRETPGTVEGEEEDSGAAQGNGGTIDHPLASTAAPEAAPKRAESLENDILEAISTNSSWRMAKWQRDYGALMATLPGSAPAIFTGITDLLDLYLLHVYLAFGDGTLLLGGGSSGGSSGSSGDGEGLTPRLRNTLQHVALGTLAPHRAVLAAGSRSGSRLARALAHSSATASTAAAGDATSGPTSPSASGPLPGGSGGPASSLSHSGNLYGLVERISAGRSAVAAARYIGTATAALEAALPSKEAPIVSLYCERTQGAAEDLLDAIVACGVRSLLPLGWVPEAVAAGPYQAAEPPSDAAPWARQLSRQLELFTAQVGQAETLAPGAAEAAWAAASRLLAAAVLDGLSRVKKCTLEGRSAMSLDLQALTQAVGRGHPGGAAAAAAALRPADDYVKGFYVPLPDLPAWAAQHPAFSAAQVTALATCIAESSGLRKRDLAAAVAGVEAGLKALGLHHHSHNQVF